MAFLFRLETSDGEPAEPATLNCAVPNWEPGDTIHSRQENASRHRQTRRRRRSAARSDRGGDGLNRSRFCVAPARLSDCRGRDLTTASGKRALVGRRARIRGLPAAFPSHEDGRGKRPRRSARRPAPLPREIEDRGLVQPNGDATTLLPADGLKRSLFTGAAPLTLWKGSFPARCSC